MQAESGVEIFTHCRAMRRAREAQAPWPTIEIEVSILLIQPHLATVCDPGAPRGDTGWQFRSPAVRQRRQHLHDRSVVAEGLAHMGENITIARSKNEAGAQLEGVPAQLVLAVARGLGLLAGSESFSSAQVEEVALPEVSRLVGAALFVDSAGGR